MNKELTPLEALEKLMDGCCATCPNDCETKRNSACPDFKKYKIIETALKALEIIKDKISWNFAIKYWWENHEINDEEYDLLKEVLL